MGFKGVVVFGVLLADSLSCVVKRVLAAYDGLKFPRFLLILSSRIQM